MCGRFRGLCVGARLRTAPEKENPSSGQFIREGLMNQVWQGQYSATIRTFSASSLILHNMCAMRLTGGNPYLHRSWANCIYAEGWLPERNYPSFPKSTPNQLDRLGISSKRSLSREGNICAIEVTWNLSSSQTLQSLLTPKEEMMGELWHAAGVNTALVVDLRDCHAVVDLHLHLGI